MRGGRHSSELEVIASEIRAKTPPVPMRTRIVAIDGLGGAGKSTLAARLSQLVALGRIVHTDDFASWEEPIEWWPRLLAQVLEPLGRNEAAHYQRFDWERRELAEWHEVAPGGVVLLEGVTASRAAFRPYLTFSIWVETPRNERLRRGLIRDGEGALGQWEEWMAAEDAYVAAERPVERADLVVAGWATPSASRAPRAQRGVGF